MHACATAQGLQAQQLDVHTAQAAWACMHMPGLEMVCRPFHDFARAGMLHGGKHPLANALRVETIKGTRSTRHKPRAHPQPANERKGHARTHLLGCDGLQALHDLAIQPHRLLQVVDERKVGRDLGKARAHGIVGIVGQARAQNLRRRQRRQCSSTTAQSESVWGGRYVWQVYMPSRGLLHVPMRMHMRW